MNLMQQWWTSLAAPTPATNPSPQPSQPSQPTKTATKADAFEAGFKFFEGPQYDGHLDDSAPGETFTTKFGVTEMSYQAAVRNGVKVCAWDAIRVADDVAPIYRHDYYLANRCDLMPACIAMLVFVDATLMGGFTPRANLQKALGVPADGAVGPHTLEALSDCRDLPGLARRLEGLNLAHLQSLPNWPKFHNGWTNRETSLLAEALKLT